MKLFMQKTTVTELRKSAKHLFDLVESGEALRVLRNGKPIADIVPVAPDLVTWRRRSAQPLLLHQVSISQFILDERKMTFC